MNLFSLDSPLFRFLNMVYNLVILHILWILYSIPLVTIGASTTALYYSCMKLLRTKEGYVHKNFHKAFKENFKQSTLIWLGMVVVGLLFTLDIRIGMSLDNTMGKVMIVGCSIFLIPLVLIAVYIFPVQAKFENRIRDNLKNALILSLKHFPLSLFILAIYATFIILTLSFPPFIGLLLCCGMGLFAYLTSNIFIFIFRKYIPDEMEQDAEKSGTTIF